MAASPTRRPSRAFLVITAIFFVLSLAALVYGLLHKSSDPQILGRYSTTYAILLTGITFCVMLLGFIIRHPSPPLVQWTGNIYTFLISALLIVGLTELGLRIFQPWGIEFFHTLPYHMQGMTDHPQLGYVHPKSVSYYLGSKLVKLNSRGLRDEEIDYTKEPNEKRILILGDSVTFGWGVSQGETFSDHMEPLLRAETGTKWQVINAGVNGYNTQQEATYLRIEGIKYQPDIVIVVYVGNDVDKMLDPNITTWRRYPTWPDSFPQALERIRSLSYLYQLTKLFARMQKSGANYEQGDSDSSLGRVLSITSHPRWPVSLTALKDIARQCESAKIPFLVARESGNDSAFFMALEQSRIEAISLAPAWAEVPSDQHRVSRIDPHPTALVHQAFAKLLVAELRLRGWLEP
jgi:hypothetical protein